jgi:histidine triad (HIT) family protein
MAGAASTEPPCVCCEIAAGRERASVVHEDDSALAFLDIRPVSAGYLLVVPRALAARALATRIVAQSAS